MLKRISVFLLMLALSLTVSSCGQSSAYGVWKNMVDTYPDQQGAVDVVADDDGNGYHVEYNGQRYNLDALDLFDVGETTFDVPEGDVLVGWDTLPFGLWYLDEYYSDTAEDPVFIYMPRLREVYLRSDYDLETDTFVPEGNNHSFVFSDVLTLTGAISYDSVSHYEGEIPVTLYSKAHPRLRISLRLFCVDGVWYAGGNSDSALFKASDELLQVLHIDPSLPAA